MLLVSNLVLVASIAGFAASLGRRKVLRMVGGDTRQLRSLPGHYGWYSVAWVLIPALLILVLWAGFGGAIVDRIMLSEIAGQNPGLSEQDRIRLLIDLRNFRFGEGFTGETVAAFRNYLDHYALLAMVGNWAIFFVSIFSSVAGGYWAVHTSKPALRARDRLETIIKVFMVICSTAAVLVTVGIVLSLVFESVRFFALVPITEFLFGVEWSPQIALRDDQVASEGAFGAVPIFAGTLLITAIAMMVAVPVGLMSAIYMTQYSRPRIRAWIKPVLEILAGVPTVVYGFFAALVIAPAIRDMGVTLGLDVASESALAAGLVMGVMIIPFMSSLSDDALASVPPAMRDGALALGATLSETIRHVLIPAALPGIMGAFLLSISRAIGETMIVVMAAGLAANLTANPLEAVTTVTAQIVTLLTGDQEFDSAKTLAAFALGLALLLVTLLINIAALQISKNYREQYE